MTEKTKQPQKKKKGRPRKNFYFTQDTEDAIILYNSLKDPKEKSKLYQKRIHYAFNRLTEAITHRFKFYETDVDYIEQLHHDVETFLLSKIHLFNPERGAKAYSYFGTIAKRFLIILNTKNYKKKIANVEVNNVDNSESHSYRLENSPERNLAVFMECFIEFVDDNLFDIFPNERDSKIADAILQIFRNREKIDIINKKAIYIYIKELIPETNTPRITRVAQRMRDIFQDNYNYYLEYDSIDFDY